MEVLDVKKSRRNQVRFRPIEDDLVASYTDAMKRGAEFPAGVAHFERGQLIVDDGNPDGHDGPGGLGNTTYEALLYGRLPAVLQASLPEVWDGAWTASVAVQDAFLTRYGPSTADAYARDLADLNRHARSLDRAPLLLRRQDLDRYLRVLLDERGLATSTVRRRAAAVAGMYRWAAEEGLLPRSPAEHLARPRASAPVPKVRISPAELVALLRAAETHSPRAAVLVHLLFGHGLRVSEAVGVDVDDLRDGAITTMIVRGKGRTSREVQLSPTAAEWVRTLCAGRAQGPVLRSRTGQRLHRTNAARLLRTVALQALPADVAVRVHPHAGRRAFAAASLDLGVGLRDVQHALGHAHGAQVLAYADSQRHHDALVPARLYGLLAAQEGGHDGGVSDHCAELER